MKTRPEIPADIYYDPYDLEIDKTVHAVWRRMREEAPLYYNEKYDFYALSRYEDVHNVLRNWQDYSSEHGTVLEIIQAVKDGQIPPFGSDNLGLMIFSDPPVHDATRRLVSQHFSPKAVTQFEKRCRTLVQHFLDKVEGQKSFDVVDAIIRPIPPMMVGEIIGVPEQDQAYLGTLVDESLTYDPELGPEIPKEGKSDKDSRQQLNDYIARLVAERKESPTDDLLSVLTQSQLKLDDGSSRNLEVSELCAFVGLLQSAGSETTARALGWAAVLLARFPEERQKLVDDPSLIRSAVEEILRYEAPSPIQGRYVNKDVEWYGVTIPAGSTLVLLNGAAGRDDDNYGDGDEFKVDRDPRHLAFGFGTHTCLGAALARLEIRVVLEELLKRYPNWTVDESEVEMVCTTTVRGPAKVPITVA